MNYIKIPINKLFKNHPVKQKKKLGQVNETGDFKVISSKKDNGGVVGYINDYEFNPNPTLITFGDQSKNIFIHDEPFSVTDNVKVLELKKEYQTKYILEYIIQKWINEIPDWGYNRYWKIAKNIEIKFPINSKNEFDVLKIEEYVKKYRKLNYIKTQADEILQEIINTEVDLSNEKENFKEIALGDKDYFSLQIGKRVLKKDLINTNGTIPLYSANVLEPIGYVNKSNLNRFSHDYILWGIDGNFEVNPIIKGSKFATTDHCGTIEIINESINYMYLIYQLNIIKSKYGFDRTLRPSLTKMEDVMIKFPVNSNGELDLNKQKEIAEKFIKINTCKNFIEENLKEFIELNVDF